MKHYYVFRYLYASIIVFCVFITNTFSQDNGVLNPTEVEQIDNPTGSDKQKEVNSIAPPVKSGLNGDNVSKILGETSNRDRYNSLIDLESMIKLDLGGTEFDTILGEKSKNSWRSKMIQVLAKHARKGINASEVAVTLGTTTDRERYNALRALEPQIQYGMKGEDFDKILSGSSKSKNKWRSRMIQVLAKHAGDQPLDINKPTSEGVSGSVFGTTNSNIDIYPESNVGKSYDSILPIMGISQRDISYYRLKNSPTTLDKLGSKQYEISKLACLATVYAMIERELGDSDAKIDDFYEDPGVDGETMVGAFIPPSNTYSPLSGKILNASFREVPGSRGTYNEAQLIEALDAGRLGILKGKRADGLVHFILVNGYKRENGEVTSLYTRDPWDGSAPMLSLDKPNHNGFSFNDVEDSMRLIDIVEVVNELQTHKPIINYEGLNDLYPDSAVNEAYDELKTSIENKLNLLDEEATTYLYELETFSDAVSLVWMDLTDTLRSTGKLREYYDDTYFAALEFLNLSKLSLIKADRELKENNIELAEKYLNEHIRYNSLYRNSVNASIAIFNNELESAYILAESIYKGSKAAVIFGSKFVGPGATSIVEGVFYTTDFAITKSQHGLEEASKQLLTEMTVDVIFKYVLIAEFNGKTLSQQLSDTTTKAIGSSKLYSILGKVIKSEEVRKTYMKFIAESSAHVVQENMEQGYIDFVHDLEEGLKSL